MHGDCGKALAPQSGSRTLSGPAVVEKAPNSYPSSNMKWSLMELAGRHPSHCIRFVTHGGWQARALRLRLKILFDPGKEPTCSWLVRFCSFIALALLLLRLFRRAEVLPVWRHRFPALQLCSTSQICLGYVVCGRDCWKSGAGHPSAV